MTLEELNAHLRLLQRRAELAAILDRLYGRAAPSAQRFDGAPHRSGPQDKRGQVEELAVEIAQLRESIDALDAEVRASEAAVEAFISGIPEARTRLVFALRFVRGLTWKQVADTMGQHVSVWSASKICYDYLQDQRTEEGSN